MNRLCFIIFGTLILNINLNAQFKNEVLTYSKVNMDTLNSQIKYERLIPAICLTVGFVIYSLSSQAHFYSGADTSFYFNFYNDWNYAKGADKFGHAFAGYSLALGTKEILQFSGVDTVSSLWLGAGVSILHQTLIEVEDGFITAKQGIVPYFGFSFGDLGADLVGALLPVAQHYSPFFSNVRYKFSINPSDFIKGKFEGKYERFKEASHDYDSKNNWLSFSVYDKLPESFKNYYPKFLNLAIGNSVKNVRDKNWEYVGGGNHELFLSFDYDMEKLLPDGADWWMAVKKFLNLYKYPAPCLKIYPELIFYPIRF
ncbi:MAG: DUF2279 domain-containing protein [Chlorobi bacterium]|nr:DUF2279 domain-containing protein [Chlorobiota bacterium]